VIGGVFSLLETHGIPLDVLVEVIDRQGALIDWVDFYEASQQSNWKTRTALMKIESAVSEVLGEDYCNEVMLRLQNYIQIKQQVE